MSVHQIRSASSVTRLATLLTEKRRTRAQLVLGALEPGAADARLRSLDSELAREWEAVRTSPGRTRRVACSNPFRSA